MHRLSVMPLALLACAGHASAQTRDATTVDAIATLAPPPAVLSIQGTGALNFGHVNAPGGNAASCRYEIDFQGLMNVSSDETGAVGSGAACNAEESWTRGIVLINCEAGGRLGFTYQAQSLENARGLIFTMAPEQIGFDGSTTRTSHACGTNNQIAIYTGGTLTVQRGTSVPETSVTVGRITIDIFYEAL